MGSAGRGEGGAPEGIGESRRGREEAAGREGTGDGCGGRGGRDAGKHAGHPGGGREAQAVEELPRAWADVRRTA